MADQQLTEPATSVTAGSSSRARATGETVRLTGPGGTDYRLALPESAEGQEIAAITASVSAHLSAETPTEPPAQTPTDSRDLWTKANRHSARTTRTRPRLSGQNGWQLAARCHR